MRTELALLLTYSNPIMTAAQVAELMGIGERSLENKIYDKSCPVPMFKLGSKYAAHITDVAKYIDDQRANAMELLQTGLQPA